MSKSKVVTAIFLASFIIGCSNSKSAKEPIWKYLSGTINGTTFRAVDKTSNRELNIEVCGIETPDHEPYKAKSEELLANLLESSNQLQIVPTISEEENKKIKETYNKETAEVYLSIKGNKVSVAQAMLSAGLASFSPSMKMTNNGLLIGGKIFGTCFDSRDEYKAASTANTKAIKEKKGINSDEANKAWEKDYRKNHRSEILQISQGTIWDLESEIERLKIELAAAKSKSSLQP